MGTCETRHVTVTTEPDAKPANALTNGSFRLLWLNNIGFFIVANAQRFVFGWLVLDGLGRTSVAQGVAVFTLGLPAAFLVLHAGAWADRHDRRLLLMTTQIAGGLVMAGTAVLIGADLVTMPVVIFITLLAGAASAIGQPVRASLIPALVDEAQLFSAIAVNALAMTVSLILGPVVAKAVGDQFGFDGVFWFMSLLMLSGVVFLLVLKIPAHENPDAPRRSIRAETTEAVRHVLDDPGLRPLFGLLMLSSFTINPAVMVTLQAHVKETIGRDAGEAAMPFASMGLGIAISSVVVMRKGNMANKGTAFMRAMMVGSTMTFLMGLMTEFTPIIVLALFMGLAGGFYINMNQGLIQANTPQALMGRVMGLYTLMMAGLMPFGALALGAIASVVGTGPTISGAAVLSFVAVVATYFRKHELRVMS